LEHLAQEVSELKYQDYKKGAKKTYFKINNTKSQNKRVILFNKQLILFVKTINNVSNAVKKNLMQAS
jgi:IS5 family transposase